jgi:hypothetical protein
LLPERSNVSSHPDRHPASPLEQYGVEVYSRERETRSDAVPQLREIDLDEQPAAVVADQLARDRHSSVGHCLFEAQGTQRAGGVPGQVDTRPGLVPGGLPLDHLDGESSLGERLGGRESGETSPDDEDSCLGHVGWRLAVGPPAVRGRNSRMARLTAAAFSSRITCDAG